MPVGGAKTEHHGEDRVLAEEALVLAVLEGFVVDLDGVVGGAAAGKVVGDDAVGEGGSARHG